MNQSSPTIKIDIDAVLRQRLPRHYKLIPRFMVNALKRFICQDKMNLMLERTAGLRDADFCRGVLEHLDITYTVDHPERIPSGDDSRVIFVSNHPLGGLDGLTLIDMLTRQCCRKVKFVVNDLLMAVEPLRDTFIPVNKHGRQSREASTNLEAAFESEAPIIVFPAGLVSRRQPDGSIADLKWQKMFVAQAVRYRRDIIPLFFSGENSSFFYNFANIRRKFGLRFNIEMTRLPAEVFGRAGSCFRIAVGERIGWSTLTDGASLAEKALAIRQKVYQLNSNSPIIRS